MCCHGLPLCSAVTGALSMVLVTVSLPHKHSGRHVKEGVCVVLVTAAFRCNGSAVHGAGASLLSSQDRNCVFQY